MDKDARLLQAEILRISTNNEKMAEDIDDINEDIVLINSDIRTTNERVTNAETNIAATADAVAAIQDDIADIKSTDTEQNSRLTNLETLTATHSNDISALKADTTSQGLRIGTLEERADDMDAAVNTLNMDVERLDIEISNANTRIDDLERKEDERAHYLGAFQTTTALQSYPTPTENDFADNYETATRWVYTSGAWSNTNEPIPTDATILGNTAPLMNGNASAGTATLASRVDHVHPSDTSRVPTTRTVNGKPLNSDITLTAADVGAVPTTRTVNNKALSANISLTATDVDAVPTTRTVNNKALSANISLTAEDVGAVPTTRTVNNKALSENISLTANDVGAYSPETPPPVWEYVKHLTPDNPFILLDSTGSDIPTENEMYEFLILPTSLRSYISLGANSFANLMRGWVHRSGNNVSFFYAADTVASQTASAADGVYVSKLGGGIGAFIYWTPSQGTLDIYLRKIPVSAKEVIN